MRPLLAKVRPTRGFAQLIHLALSAVLPIVAFILVRIDLVPFAFLLVLISKWRTFAVKPRFWPGMIRANAVDIMVGLAIVVFMSETISTTWQIIWTVAHIVWLVTIKPSSKSIFVAIQGLVGMTLALGALFVLGGGVGLIWLVLGGGAICYFSANHFFGAFDERHAQLLAYIWAFFGASLIWILGHWLLYYGDGLIAQPALFLLTIGYGLSAIYYLDHTTRLTGPITKQLIFIMLAITIILLALSDWGDKIV